MGMGLNAAKAKLQQDIQKALNDAFKEAYKATFIYGGGDEGDTIAKKFADKGAQTAAGPIADAILSFVSQAQIVGVNPVVQTIIATPTVGGPCNGVLNFNGSELSLI
jgi:hypothetical protein